MFEPWIPNEGIVGEIQSSLIFNHTPDLYNFFNNLSLQSFYPDSANVSSFNSINYKYSYEYSASLHENLSFSPGLQDVSFWGEGVRYPKLSFDFGEALIMGGIGESFLSAALLIPSVITYTSLSGNSYYFDIWGDFLGFLVRTWIENAVGSHDYRFRVFLNENKYNLTLWKHLEDVPQSDAMRRWGKRREFFIEDGGAYWNNTEINFVRNYPIRPISYDPVFLEELNLNTSQFADIGQRKIFRPFLNTNFELTWIENSVSRGYKINFLENISGPARLLIQSGGISDTRQRISEFILDFGYSL